MKSLVALSTALVASAALLVPADASASAYPPDYDYCPGWYSLSSGPFEFIQDWVQDDDADLTIAYRGYLRDHFPDHEINFYIRVNGNDAFVPASAGANDDAYVLIHGGPYDCGYCTGAGCVQPSWVCSWPSSVEEHLLYWGWSSYQTVNAWDVEVAAESHGYWDSNYGQNYSVRFEPYGCN